jgi:DNA polymerase III subunit delta'
VPGFDAIIGQARPIRILTRLLAHGTLPHALLFSGLEGVGKKTTATALIQACNCLGRRGAGEAEEAERAAACGVCAPCRKIAGDCHPDLRRLAPQGGLIKIEAIRELCAFLAMKPFEAGIRAVVIAEAQTMNAAAGNALLKMLEEPPPRTVMILTTAQAAEMLPTVVSRCRRVPFAPLSRRVLTEILIRNHGLDPVQAERAAALAGGSVTRALALADEGLQRRRGWLMERLFELPGASALAPLALAEKLARDKSGIPGDLDLITAWLRDVAVARECPDHVIYRESLGPLTHAAQRLPAGEIADAVNALQEAQRRIRAHANPRLVLETLFVHLAARFRPAA